MSVEIYGSYLLFKRCLIMSLTALATHSPSTFANASTDMVCRAGMAQATRWNRCDLFSMASWPHFRPAAKNQANAKHDHQANAAIQQKYKAMNSTVQAVDCRWP